MGKQKLKDLIDELETLCSSVCTTIWNNPEESGKEVFASSYYADILREEGFSITVNENLPHAFTAEWGKGYPCLAILGEYDALPGLSQKVSAVKEPENDSGLGHGCGHNLLGAAAVTSAIALKRAMTMDGLEGTIRFYGCPEEELLCGKVKMAYYNMFDGCDFALSWHPMSANMVYDSAYLANASGKFYFSGVSSHAGFAPQNGRSASDAMELMNVGVQYLREHVEDKTRIHYTCDYNGYAPNIVHPDARSWYFVRAPFIKDVKSTLERVKKCATGAAIMTETQVRFIPDSGCCEMLNNKAFADLTYKNLLDVPTPEYTKDEIDFARKIQDTVTLETCSKEREIYNQMGPMYEGAAPREQWVSSPLNASTDSGDVSHIMPMNLFTAACWPLGVAPHTWQAAACAGSTIGRKGALWAARVIAGTAYDLLTDHDVRERIRKEFAERKVNDYVPMYEG